MHALFILAALFLPPCPDQKPAVKPCCQDGKCCSCPAVKGCECPDEKPVPLVQPQPENPQPLVQPVPVNQSTMRFAMQEINKFHKRFDALDAEIIGLGGEMKRTATLVVDRAGVSSANSDLAIRQLGAIRAEFDEAKAGQHIVNCVLVLGVIGILACHIFGFLGKNRYGKCLALLVLWPATAGANRACAQVQLAPAKKLADMRATFPATVDQEWQQFARDPWTLYYTNAEVPPAYQHNMGGMGRTTFHDPANNISADDLESMKGDGFGGNPNIESPWRMPGGTDAAEGRHNTFRMMRLPLHDGKPWPVVYWREHDRYSGADRFTWVYPIGTTFAEVLCTARPDGFWQCYEVRLRIRGASSWTAFPLRPFPEHTDLVAALKSRGASPELIAQVERPVDWRPNQVMRDRLHRRSGFESTAAVEVLPEIPSDLAVSLLAETPFKSAAGYSWREVEGADCFAPTTKQKFSIVPVGYTGTFLGTDSQSCSKCHESSGVNEEYFDNVRQWYGYVRGSGDGIFTWHPIDPQSIADNGASLPVSLRREFVDAGYIEPYDRGRHPPEVYTMTEDHIR